MIPIEVETLIAFGLVPALVGSFIGMALVIRDRWHGD